jgi:hypothetical protein
MQLNVKKYMWIALVIVIGLQVSVHLISILSDLKVKNEFYYLDQKTILKSGEIVNNSEYESKKLRLNPIIFGNDRYPSSANVYINKNDKFIINQTPNFEYFSFLKMGEISSIYNKNNYLIKNKIQPFVLKPYIDKEIIFSMPELFNYYYSDCRNKNEIDEAYVKYQNRSVYKTNLDAWNHILPNCEHPRFQKTLPLFVGESDEDLEEILDYIQKNYDEKALQSMDRYYFHETAFVLSPINEMRLGKPYKEIFSQYGFLSVLGVSVVMDLFGGFSWPNYEKAIKTFYLLYYIIAVFVIFSFLQNNVLRLAYLLVLAIGLYGNSYYFYEYPPGHSPIRHILDLVVFYCIFKTDEKNKLSYAVLAVLFSILSIFINKEYGMMLALGLLGAYIFELIYEFVHYKKIIIIKFISILAISLSIILSLIYYPLAENPSAKYFLDGFYSFKISDFQYYILLLSISFQLLLLMIYGKFLYNIRLLKLYVFSSLYSQLLYFYFVWGGGHAHFFVLVHIYSLPIFVLISRVKFENPVSKIIMSALVVFMGLIVTLYFMKFIGHWRHSTVNFDSHVTYEWTTERAEGLKTKIDPKLFKDSVDVVKKYSNDSNVANFISKYDNVINILASKYSSTNFFELRSLIVTKGEYDLISNQLLKSEIIYVDKDIDADFESEIKELNFWNLISGLAYENRYQRVLKLAVLRQLYRDIILTHYHKIDSGGLLDVYKKNSL